MDMGTVVIGAAVRALVSKGANSAVEKFIKPKWVKFKKEKALKSKLLEERPEVFCEYLVRSYEKHCYLKTVVFSNSKKMLKDLYVPLSIKEYQFVQEKGESFVIIDDVCERFLHEKVLIVDTAGMGKTTIMKYLFLEAIVQGMGIPIFIELRSLSAKQGIIQKILEEIKEIQDEFFDEEILGALIKEGDFIFFFDGYDEIPVQEKEEVSKGLANFISKAGTGNTFFMSSRNEGGLVDFADFQRYEIEPLGLEDAVALIAKYGGDDEVAQGLINELRNSNNEMLKDFLGNSLLVSLLYRAYDYRKSIPQNKGAFYRQVYDALFLEHDLSKGARYYREKSCGLRCDDFHKMLRIIGFKSFFKAQKVSYGKDELLNLIDDCRKKSNLKEFGATAFLEDLLQAVPLFHQDGVAYKWAHKSFQEYFAACYICFDMGGQKEAILEKMADSKQYEKYDNLLDLCYDLDESTMQRVLFLKVLTRLERKYEQLYERFGNEIDCELVAFLLCRGEDVRVCVYSIADEAFPAGNLADEGFLAILYYPRTAWKPRLSLKHIMLKQYNSSETMYSIESAFVCKEGGFEIVFGLSKKKNLQIFRDFSNCNGEIATRFLNEHIGKEESLFSLQDALDNGDVDGINGFCALQYDALRWEEYFSIHGVKQMIERIKGQINAINDFLEYDL